MQVTESCGHVGLKQWKRRIKSLAAGTLTIAWCCLCPMARSTEHVVQLSTKADSFFKEEAFTGSSYVHFRTNGTYSRIDRQHLFVEEDDRGTWTQDPNGRVTMKSAWHYRNIESAPLAIWTWHKDVPERLPDIHATITGLLRTNDSKRFDSEFIGERLVRLPSVQTNSYSPISVEWPVEQVSRNQLRALLQAVEAFTNRTDNHHFHVVPMSHQEVIFLLWQDSGTPSNRSLSRIKEAIEKRDRKKGGAVVLPYVYTRVDKHTFANEAKRTQEFIFHPEMNRPRKTSSVEQE